MNFLKSDIYLYFIPRLNTQQSSFLKIDYAGATKDLSGCSLGQKLKVNCYLLTFQNMTDILLICLLLNYHNPVCFVAVLVCDL